MLPLSRDAVGNHIVSIKWGSAFHTGSVNKDALSARQECPVCLVSSTGRRNTGPIGNK